jgi:hypothetical protein
MVDLISDSYLIVAIRLRLHVAKIKLATGTAVTNVGGKRETARAVVPP